MATKKKRNKQYKGSVQAKPTIVKVSAVKRHPIHQWFVDRKRLIKPVGIGVGIAVFVVVLVVGLISVFTS